jgi:thiol:disulfide interchange protein DsbD
MKISLFCHCERSKAIQPVLMSGRVGLLRRLRLLAMTVLVFTLFVPVLASATANLLTTSRTQTTIMSGIKTIHAGEKFWVALHIKLNPGWHTYWINPGDSGITPQLDWTLPNGFTAGATQYLAPDRERVGPLVDYAYDTDAHYLVAITPPPILRAGTVSILALKASWLVCKDICVPESGGLSLSLPAGDMAEPGDDAKEITALVARIPQPLSSDIKFHKTEHDISFDVALKDLGAVSSPVKSALFFPETQQLMANGPDQKVQVSDSAVSFILALPEGKLVESGSGVMSLFLQDGKRMDYALHLQMDGSAASAGVPAASQASDATPVAAITPAPVAIPVLPANIYEPMKEHVTLVMAIAYALLGGLILNGMPCVFPVLSLKALAVAKKAAAHPSVARKQGIAYTIGVIASFLLLASLLLAFQKTGQSAGWGYQMQSPPFVALLSLLLFAVGLNLAGYFELPVLLGGVGAEGAAKDSAWGSFLTGILAVMVATPCSAPFMASAVSYALTQDVVTVMGIFIALGLGLASPFLLISFFPGLIKALPKPGEWMNTFKELLSFPMFGWTVWLLWVLAREAGGTVVCIVLFAMVLIAFALWLSRRESGLLKFIALLAGVAAIAATVYAAQMPMLQPAATLVQGAEHFSPARLEALRKEGKAVFVDATADWCLICKVNENVALSSGEVKEAFRQKQVAYLVADWTNGNADITHYLESFGRSGVPIYVYYPSGGGAPVVLPQVLTTANVLQVLQ